MKNIIRVVRIYSIIPVLVQIYFQCCAINKDDYEINT